MAPLNLALLGEDSAKCLPVAAYDVDIPRLGRIRLGERLGVGSFGQVFAAADLGTGKDFAVKLQVRGLLQDPEQSSRSASDSELLVREAEIYATLAGSPGVPTLHWFGDMGGSPAMVIDRLGPSLWELFRLCECTFRLSTVLMLADQLIQCIESVHSSGFVYRDVKPHNFLMGLGFEARRVHIIDFGLAKAYINPETHQHISYRESDRMTGTPLYTSLNAHRGGEQSRRDDLEALGHMLIVFLRGSLPWQGLRASTRSERCSRISEIKQAISAEALCDGLPKEFLEYLRYCRSLGFDEKPDYAYLRRLFNELLLREFGHADLDFDWSLLSSEVLSSEAEQAPRKAWSTPDIVASDLPLNLDAWPVLACAVAATQCCGSKGSLKRLGTHALRSICNSGQHADASNALQRAIPDANICSAAVAPEYHDYWEIACDWIAPHPRPRRKLRVADRRCNRLARTHARPRRSCVEAPVDRRTAAKPGRLMFVSKIDM